MIDLLEGCNMSAYQIKIPYFINRYLEFTLNKLKSDNTYRIILSIWTVRKLTDIPGHENEWGGLPLKHILLFSRKLR